MYYRFSSTDVLPDVLDISIVRQHVRVDGDDTMLGLYLKGAMRWAEGFCDQPLFRRTFTATRPGFNYTTILPGVNPVLTQVGYKTTTLATGLPTILDPAAYALASDFSLSYDPVLVNPLKPTFVQITYTAGYAITDLPEDIRVALLMVTGNIYDNRANPPSEKRTAAENMLQPYRLY